MQHLVQVLKTKKKDGLVGISVCINLFKQPLGKAEASAKKILKDKGIDMTNLFLTMDADEAQKRFHIKDGFPYAVIFDRRGKWRVLEHDEESTKKMDDQIDATLKAK